MICEEARVRHTSGLVPPRGAHNDRPTDHLSVALDIDFAARGVQIPDMEGGSYRDELDCGGHSNALLAAFVSGRLQALLGT